jgi:nucleotide-binding universal stress UspA family protein
MFRNILTAIDLTEESSWVKSIPTAVELCQSAGSRLHLMTVIPDFGMSIVSQHFPKDYAEKALASARAELEAFAGKHIPDDVQPTLVIAQGTIYEEIIRVGDEVSADLIVVASHRPSLKDYLLGPNAARVVRHANCSVMVVRE